MNKYTVFNILSEIPIGTLVAWVAAICAIITFLCIGIIKLFKVFTKYKELRDKEEERVKRLDEYGETLQEIKKSIIEICDDLAIQSDVNLKQLRYSIIQICDAAISEGQISAGKFKLLNELYDEYVQVFHANGYIKELVTRTLDLPIHGTLDE